MEVHLTTDLQAKLIDSAAQQGRNPDELIQEVLARYFEDQIGFVDAVKRGEEALQRGEFLTHEEAGHRLQRFLKP